MRKIVKVKNQSENFLGTELGDIMCESSQMIRTSLGVSGLINRRMGHHTPPTQA